MAELDARFAAHLEKLDFDSTAAAEELLALQLRRVAAVEQASQRLGDLAGMLAAKAFQERLRSQHEPGPEIATPAALANAWKECSAEWTRMRDAQSRKRADLISKYHAYLTAQVSTLTKAGKMVEAKQFHQRAQDFAPTLSATTPERPAPSPPAFQPPTPTARPTRPDIPSLLKASQPAFWVAQDGWRSLPLDKLEINAGPKGTRLIFPDRDVHAKLVLGRQPLRIGEEWVVEAAGLHALEMVLPTEPGQSLTFRTPDREAVHRFRLTRTADAIEVECNGKPHPGAERYGLAKKDPAAFLASDLHPSLSFYEKNSPRLVRLEYHPSVARPATTP